MRAALGALVAAGLFLVWVIGGVGELGVSGEAPQQIPLHTEQNVAGERSESLVSSSPAPRRVVRVPRVVETRSLKELPENRSGKPQPAPAPAADVPAASYPRPSPSASPSPSPSPTDQLPARPKLPSEEETPDE